MTDKHVDGIVEIQRKISRGKITYADAAKFLELLLSDCGAQHNDDHNWRKCPRCLAINEIESYSPLAVTYLTAALHALRTKP